MIDSSLFISAADCERFDELTIDANAAAKVFEDAQRRYHNTLNSLDKRSREIWTHMRHAYNLDPAKHYTLQFSTIDGKYAIVEDEGRDNG